MVPMKEAEFLDQLSYYCLSKKNISYVMELVIIPWKACSVCDLVMPVRQNSSLTCPQLGVRRRNNLELLKLCNIYN